MAADGNMDVDMDIDLTIDEDDEIARLNAQAAALDAPANGATTEPEIMPGVEGEAPEEGEVDQYAPVPKVHVSGVESFNPEDVKAYISEHYPSESFKRVQWVNDNALNLVYDSEVAVAEALQAFSAEERADPVEVRPAKKLSAKPDVELSVRQAVVSDVKVKDARVQSRFYLFNPEWDPDSKKRRYDDRGYRGRDYHGHKRPRRDVGDELYQRGQSRDVPFDVNLYDDDPASLTAREKRSDSRSSERSAQVGKRLRLQDDLVESRESGRLRDRTASPLLDGDGRFGFEDNQPRRRTARPRNSTSPHLRTLRGDRENLGIADKRLKELFPAKTPSSTPLTSDHTDGKVELFPNHSSPPKGPRELLPNHRRQDAHDLDHEYMGGVEDGRQSANHDKPRDLFSRIDGRLSTKVQSSYGRLQDRPRSSGDEDTGVSFKGAGDAGYSILGASKERPQNPLSRELFPMKAGSGGDGKDLFDGRIKGRGAQRRRAGDLF